MAFAANALTMIDGICYNLDKTKGTAEVTSNLIRPYSGDLSLPSTITYNGLSYSVTSIGYKAFYNSSITSINISVSVESIGDDAFYECSRLYSVVIPDSVKRIGMRAFYNCKNLTSVTIGNGIMNIKEHDFYGCVSLTSVTLGNGVTKIDEGAFEGCKKLTSVIIPKNVKVIGVGAFRDCSSLISATIGDGVKSIGDNAFSNCKSLTSVAIPESVESVGVAAFEECASLASVTIADGVKSIGIKAFYDCSTLNSVIIPNSVTVIEESTFQGCESLTSAKMPESLTSIKDNAFAGCKKLTSINIPTNVTSIGTAAFQGCSCLSYVIIPDNVTGIAPNTFSGCVGLASVNILGRVTYIGSGAFRGCSDLTSIDIPNSVTSIGEDAFSGCNGLLSIEVESGNTVYDSRENCNAIIETASNKLLFGCQNTIIPNNVTNIGESAFYGCSGLTSIDIPNSVTRIEDHAFAYCWDLATVIIPNSVTSISDGAFLSTGMKDMYCHAEQVPKTGTNIFDNSNREAMLHVPAASMDAYGNAEQWKNFKEIVALLAMDDYCMMVKDGNVWKTGIYGSGNPVRHVEYFYFDGDTIIDGKTCKQMMCQQYYNDDDSQHSSLSYVGAWYEEDKKVYTYDTTNKQFVLKYDFSVDANDTLQINQEHYRIGPWQIGGIKGFKGVYRDVWFLAEEGNPIYSPFWLEGVGSIDGPTVNVYSGYVDPLRFLMSCTVDDEVIYFNDEYEDGATPEELNANKHRFDFTHTVKTQPKVPSMGGEERQKGVASSDMQSLYGEYSQQLLSIRLDPLDETYVVCITNESNEVIYEKTINTVDIVGLNIDISTYAKGCYTATVENSNESFVGEFEVQATGIEPIINKNEDARTYIYNLQGQRIRFLQKGLNIVNGRKIYVK